MKINIARTYLKSCFFEFPRFKEFRTDFEHDSVSLLEITEGLQLSFDYDITCELFDNSIFWNHKEGELCVSIIDNDKILLTHMSFDKSYYDAEINYSNKSSFSLEDILDLNAFFFFQIRLLFTPGIILHSAAIDWHGKGVLFSAPSETGKSTQANLWVKHENAQIINGDRPALTVIDEKVEVHGTPWSGTESIIRNISAPVYCIVMLEQATYNQIYRLTPSEALNIIIPRFFLPYFDEQLMDRALKIVNDIINRVPIYKLKCLPDVGAVEILKKELSLLEE